MVYVVRVTDLDHEERYKVYRALPDAREVFGMANRAVWLSERKAAYLYEVPGEDDPLRTREAVKAGNAIILDRDSPVDGYYLH